MANSIKATVSQNTSLNAAINKDNKLSPVKVEQVTSASLGFSNIDNTRDLDKPISNLTQAALNLKANIASPTFTGTVGGITQSMVGLDQVANQSPAIYHHNTTLTGIPTAPTADSPTNTTQIATTEFVQTRVTNKLNELIGTAGTTLDSLGELADALNDSPLIIINLKAQVNAHTARTDNPHAVTQAQVGLGNVTNESKATMFANPTFTGTVSGITKAMVGLPNVEDKSSATIRGEIVDSDIPSTITRDSELSAFTGSTNITTVGTIGTGVWQGTAINPTYIESLSTNKITSGVFSSPRLPNRNAGDITTGVFSSPRLPNRTAGDITTGVFHADRIPNNLPTTKINSGVFDSPRIPKLNVHAGKITAGTIDDARIPSSIARDSELSAHTNSTANPHSVTKAQVGLGSVDNTSDQDKPVSTAQQAVFDTKAPTANPTFTGTVSGITKAMVGLDRVANQSPAELPISAATQTALDLKAPLANPALTGNPTAPTQLASDNTTKIATTEYVTTAVAAIVDSAPGSLNTLNELAEALNDSPSQIDNILSSVGQRLVIGNNLSDLNNAATARTNLGLGNVEDTALSTFAGTTNITTLGTITTGTWNGTAIDSPYIVALDAGKITTGVFSSPRLPGLGAADITTGVFSSPRIPNMNIDAAKVTSGVFSSPRLPGLAAGDITTGVFSSPRIPNMEVDAAKITSGVFSSPRLPGLAAADITTGVFSSPRIPNMEVDAAKITSGVFSSPRLPGLAAGDITTGVFSSPRLPGLAAADITTGVFSSPRLPGLATGDITTGTFADARIASSNVTQHSGDITSVGTLTGLTSSGTVNVGSTPAYSQTRKVKVFDDGTANAARVSLIGTGDGGNPALEFVTDGELAKRTLIRHEADGPTGDYSLNFFTSDGGSVAQRFRIAGSGNVGINTGSDSPASRLHIVQSGQNLAGGIKLEKSDNSNTWSVWQNSSGTLLFQNAATATGSATTRAWLNTSGKLNVTGDLNVGGVAYFDNRIDFGERAADDVLIKGESDGNDITLLRGASNANSVGVDIKYIGSGSGDGNIFEIATDGGGSFKMDQSGDCGINQAATTGIDLTLATAKITGSLNIDTTATAATQETILDAATGQDNLISFKEAGAAGGSIRYVHNQAGSNMQIGIAGNTALTIAVTNISTDRPITSSGTIKSTSTVSQPIQSDETDDSPINNIRRMTQTQYNAITPDPNTLYIIV